MGPDHDYVEHGSATHAAASGPTAPSAVRCQGNIIRQSYTQVYVLQVLAYALVEPDRFAEKIYVADTGAQLAALVQSGTGATALPCADLLSALAAGAGADPGAGPSPEAQGDASAWDAGGLAAATATCMAGANETDVQLTRVAVSLLQAFVDTHGCVP